VFGPHDTEAQTVVALDFGYAGASSLAYPVLEPEDIDAGPPLRRALERNRRGRRPYGRRRAACAWSRLAQNCAVDRRAIETMGRMLEGSERRLLVTTGVALLAPGRTATEDDIAPPVSGTFPRASEAVTAEFVT
jgi:hypothetical protein